MNAINKKLVMSDLEQSISGLKLMNPDTEIPLKKKIISFYLERIFEVAYGILYT
jgi:hypothetical protein